jgi:hypothetical protein
MGMSSALESLCGIIAPPVVGWLTESAGTNCTALHSTPIVSINGSDSMRV